MQLYACSLIKSYGICIFEFFLMLLFHKTRVYLPVLTRRHDKELLNFDIINRLLQGAVSMLVLLLKGTLLRYENVALY